PDLPLPGAGEEVPPPPRTFQTRPRTGPRVRRIRSRDLRLLDEVLPPEALEEGFPDLGEGHLDGVGLPSDVGGHLTDGLAMPIAQLDDLALAGREILHAFQQSADAPGRLLGAFLVVLEHEGEDR